MTQYEAVFDRAGVVDELRRGGIVAAEDEANDLIDAAADAEDLARMVARRLDGEPTAWITGHMQFAGVRLRVDPGVYVPRWKSEALARHALDHLPADGSAIDLCTGTGALAVFLRHHRPAATITATDLDPAAVACAQANGVDARLGSLFDPLPATRVDVITAVPPYVPSHSLRLLARDVAAFEPVLAHNGGVDGLDVARAIVDAAPARLTSGGALLVEVGIDQVDQLAATATQAGLVVHHIIEDGDGDPASVCAVLA